MGKELYLYMVVAEERVRFEFLSCIAAGCWRRNVGFPLFLKDKFESNALLSGQTWWYIESHKATAPKGSLWIKKLGRQEFERSKFIRSRQG